MSGGWRQICPVCGNYKQGGICLRCSANAATRKKRWRRGDRGGVRPERRFNRKQTEPDAPVKQQNKKRLSKESSTSVDAFYWALQGVWYSEQEKILIDIDLARNHWLFTLKTGQKIVQNWNLKSKSLVELRFARKGKEIRARVARDGKLMLTGKHAPVPFVYILEGNKYRLCRKCFNKSEWRRKRCSHCSRRFS